MNEKIKVILYSEFLGFTYFVKNDFVKENAGKIDVIEYVSDISELEPKCQKNKDALVLVCAINLTQSIKDQIFAILEKNNLYCIAIIEDTKDGFVLMRKGALATITFKESNDKLVTENFTKRLATKIRDSQQIKKLIKQRELKRVININSKKIIAIGSSTGGTEAVLSVLRKLPAEVPPILIVQHMPAGFTKMYAERLNSVCNFTVWEAKDGDILKPGLALIAPGDCQMRLVRKGSDYAVKITKEGKVNGVAPAVDVLFNSIAEVYPKNTIAVILTGMGSDGAKGILNLRQKGAFTIGQDEKTCVVYGMPKVAYEIGGVKVQAPLNKIDKIILENI